LRTVLLLALLAARPIFAAGPVTADSARTDSLPSPRGALLRSALLPGWGQLYTGKPVKAVFFGGAAAGLLGWVVAEQRDLARIADELEGLRVRDPDSFRIPSLEQAHQDQAARRNTRILFLALAATFSALDAYVDAHLAGFDAAENSLALEPRPGGALLCLHAAW